MSPTTILQNQPCPTSCVSTCVAMLLAIPVAAVIEKHHDAYHRFQVSVGGILRSYGVQFESFTTAETQHVDRSGLWILGAPSLNVEGGMHEILLEYDAENAVLWIFDPRHGAPDRKFYRASPDDPNPLGRDLGGYYIDAFIPAAEVQRVRAAQ